VYFILFFLINYRFFRKCKCKWSWSRATRWGDFNWINFECESGWEII